MGAIAAALWPVEARKLRLFLAGFDEIIVEPTGESI